MRSLNDYIQATTHRVRTLLTGTADIESVAPQRPRPILRKPPTPAATASEALRIMCPDPTAEDALRDSFLQDALWFVRQERWEDLADIIRTSDQSREMTPGAMPIAELMAYGARADVVAAVEHAMMDGKPAKDAPLLDGIVALEHVLAEFSDDPMIACIVAQAHMDIAWAWRGTGWEADVPAGNMAVFEAHFERAANIMAPFCPKEHDSPLLAATCCALLAGEDARSRQVSDRYEKLITLNPANPRSMRTMGNHLLPRWYGSYEELELQARRIAALTSETWGAGGYTWVLFDAIAFDDQACANLDLEFFIDGLHDILDRNPDPYIVNLLAAYCANAIGQCYSGNDEADQIRTRIADCTRWIVREHLTELHPMLWAHAARGFDNNFQVRSPSRFAAAGRDDAMRIITSLFSREIAAGNQIVFTETGPIAQMA